PEVEALRRVWWHLRELGLPRHERIFPHAGTARSAAWSGVPRPAVLCPARIPVMTVDFHDIEAPGLLTWLQGWYTSMCDGDWEHVNGVSIDTLDNPGWSLRIQITGTSLDIKPFDRVKIERDE